MDHIEPACPFDTSQYTGKPDVEPVEKSLDMPEIIKKLDSFFAVNDIAQAGEFLDEQLQNARDIGDWRSELSILSELIGYHRRSGKREKGIAAVNDALELIKEHGMGRTISGATVILNAATTLKCFGEAEKSIPLFTHVSRVYSELLSPYDYRFAGLYNNLALSYEDMGELKEAERYIKMALSVLERMDGNENDMAASLCSLAEIYYKTDNEDQRVENCMEQAWNYLNSPKVKFDGYHAFTLTKCISAFDYFGYFIYSKELKERVKAIYEGD